MGRKKKLSNEDAKKIKFLRALRAHLMAVEKGIADKAGVSCAAVHYAMKRPDIQGGKR